MNTTLLRWLPLALAFISGSAGLAHQLIWTRRLVDLLGGTSLTFSRVLGCFFLGLAAGAALASLRTPRGKAAWIRVAAAEGFVALLSLPVLYSFELASIIPAWRGVLPWLGPILLIVPPAAAMGLVIPWMIGAMEGRRGAELPLYSLNTLGAVCGVAWVVLWGFPMLGLNGSGLFAAGLNIAVSCGALALAGRTEAQVARSRAMVPRLSWKEIGLAAVSGFAVLASEVLVQHQTAQVSINSMFSNASVLVWVLLALGVAGLLVQWMLGRGLGEGTLLRNSLLIAALVCSAQPIVFNALRPGVEALSYELLPSRYFRELGKLNLATLFPVFCAAGLVFPLLMRVVNRDKGAGAVAALLAWNGIGGWLGAETAQWIISPGAGLWAGMGLIGLLYALAAVLAADFRIRHWAPVAATALIVLVVTNSAARFPHVRLENGEKVLECRVGPDGVVAAVEAGPGDRRLLLNNTYSLGGTRAQMNQERQSHIPLLLHGEAQTVGVLGIATGSTVAGATLHPTVERIEAAELCGDVLRFAKTHFSPWVRGAFTNSSVRATVQDARWLVATRRNEFDVVIGDLFLPWRTGEGRMFAREHFQAVRASLKKDGLFCQWLPMFQLTRAQYDTICRTFLEVFPEAFLVRGDFYTELPILGLVGGRSLEAVDWQATGRACARLREGDQVTDALVRHAEGIAMTIIGPLPRPEPGPINTLANAWLELDAGRNVVGLQAPWFIGVPAAEYVRDVHRPTQAIMPPQLRAAHDAGQFCLTLEISAKLELPVTEHLMSQIPWRFPRALVTDLKADWQQWPMRVKPSFSIESRSFSSPILGKL